MLRHCRTAGFALLILVLTGCQAGGPAGGIDTITAHYDAGRYEAAYDAAVVVQRRGAVTDRREGGYLAGLSAYQLKRYPQARRYLEPVAQGEDALAGNAAATLGLVEYDQGRYRESIPHFRRAARLLTGQEKAEAVYRCGLAHERLEQFGQARLQFIIARATSADPDFHALLDQHIEATGYTVQLGAFSSRINAEKAANAFNISPPARVLGAARIVARRRGEEVLYLVHVGEFPSHEAAVRARTSLDRSAIVTALAPRE